MRKITPPSVTYRAPYSDPPSLERSLDTPRRTLSKPAANSPTCRFTPSRNSRASPFTQPPTQSAAASPRDLSCSAAAPLPSPKTRPHCREVSATEEGAAGAGVTPGAGGDDGGGVTPGAGDDAGGGF